jgi:hypothetical protein
MIDAWLEVVSTGAVIWKRTQPVPELVNSMGKLSEYVPVPKVLV